jgi:uncharacterized protein (TIGR03067 family)
MRRSAVLPAVVAGLVVLGTGSAQEPAAGAKLDGKWYTVRQEHFGNVVPPVVSKRLKLVVDGDKMEWYIGNPAPNQAATFTLDPAKKTIDATVTRGSLNGRTMKGIYKVEGGELHLCWAEIDARARPEKFASTKPGGGVFEYTVYSRDPAKAGAAVAVAKGPPDVKGPPAVKRPAGPRPKLADLKLDVPKGWEAKYNDIVTWRVSHGGFQPSVEILWLTTSSFPKDLDDLVKKARDDDYFGSGLYLTAVTEKGNLPDGHYVVGRFKVGKDGKDDKYSGFVVVREFAGERLRFDSASSFYRDEKLLKEALQMCKTARFPK